MKLREVLEMSAQALGIDEKDQRRILKTCANMTLYDVATQYYDCVRTQTFEVTDNEINLADLKERLHKIRKVSVPYELYSGFIGVRNGTIEVEYASIPKYVRLDEHIEKKCAIMDESILLYGVLMHYASISSLKDEERIFKRKFEDALFGLCKIRRGKIRVMK